MRSLGLQSTELQRVGHDLMTKHQQTYVTMQPAIALLDIFPKGRRTYAYKNLHMIVHSSFIYNNPQTGNNQKVPQQTMAQQTVVHPYHGTVLSC